MNVGKTVVLGGVAIAVLVAALLETAGVTAQQPAIAIDDDDIGGVVTGPDGPEAGVWVIAETTDLPTRFRRTSGVLPTWSRMVRQILGSRFHCPARAVLSPR